MGATYFIYMLSLFVWFCFHVSLSASDLLCPLFHAVFVVIEAVASEVCLSIAHSAYVISAQSPDLGLCPPFWGVLEMGAWVSSVFSFGCAHAAIGGSSAYLAWATGLRELFFYGA